MSEDGLLASSLMTFTHVGKSLLLEKAKREEENEPVKEPRGAVRDTGDEGGCNIMETEDKVPRRRKWSTALTVDGEALLRVIQS